MVFEGPFVWKPFLVSLHFLSWIYCISLFFFPEGREFSTFIFNFEQEPSPSSRGHGSDLLQSICVFIQNSKTVFWKLGSPSNFIIILDDSVSDLAGSVSFALPGLVGVPANATVHASRCKEGNLTHTPRHHSHLALTFMGLTLTLNDASLHLAHACVLLLVLLVWVLGGGCARGSPRVPVLCPLVSGRVGSGRVGSFHVTSCLVVSRWSCCVLSRRVE